MAILQYVEETYPEIPLLPDAADKTKRALAIQRFHETSVLFDAIASLYVPMMYDEVNTDEEKEKFKKGIEKAHKELEWFNGYLSDGRSFLVGDMFTLADIVVATTLFLAESAGATFAKHPAIAAYADRLRERPSFHSTWPPTWLEGDTHDWLSAL